MSYHLYKLTHDHTQSNPHKIHQAIVKTIIAFITLAKDVSLKHPKCTRSPTQITNTIVRVITSPLRLNNNRESPRDTLSHMHDSKTKCNSKAQNLKR